MNSFSTSTKVSLMVSFSSSVLFAVAVCFVPIAHAAIEYAQVTGGRLQGTLSGDIAVFKGIPYAAPPVGELRWKKPQPLHPWKGIRKADTFAPACQQSWWVEPNPTREDCLYLNVWTRATSAKERRPVMVWIHGGGFRGGMSWEPVSDGTHYAQEGVVLVTIAYRLGALGFLAHPELTREEGGKASGNYGLFDMVAALQWIHDNIARFGGDPNKVTIFGGSAGGTAVGYLAGATQAKGLFQRGISEGGTAFYPHLTHNFKFPYPLPSLKMSEQMGREFFKKLGVVHLEQARQVAALKVYEAGQDEQLAHHPNVDGELIRMSNVELYRRGKFNDTPILIGFNSDEGGGPPANYTSARFKEDVASFISCQGALQTVELLYPDATDEQASSSYRAFFQIGDEGWSNWTWARMQTAHGHSPAYLYYFDVHDAEHPHGAPHASEYPYTFGNFPRPATDSDIAVSKLMRQYWINFATRGDPNGPGLPDWQPFDPQTGTAMVFANASGSAQPLPGLPLIKILNQLQSCQ